MAASFYEMLFTSDGSSGANVLLENIAQVVTAEMNAALTSPIKDD